MFAKILMFCKNFGGYATIATGVIAVKLQSNVLEVTTHLLDLVSTAIVTTHIFQFVNGNNIALQIN